MRAQTMAVSRLISRRRTPATVLVLVTIAIAGCGSSGSGPSTAASSTATGPVRRARPQAIQPAAGVQASPSGAVAAPAAPSAPAAGDVNAHAPTLAQVKRELKQLNLCGGVTDRADATPVVPASSAGFVADPGTSQTQGQLPVLTSRLDALGTALGVTIYGISGYRTPAHSVAVGGFAHDPHTQGKAEDIGVNSLLRSSAAQISEPELARFGLYRPFDPTNDPNNTEVNHIQLIPSGGPLSLARSTATWDPDPTCR
jgi:hypothetical protein